MDNRITYLKATGIMLVVLGHSGCSIPYVVPFLYMFHMPLFFFASGYCFKSKYLSEPITFVKRRVKGVWLPYVKYSLLFLLLHNVFYSIHLYDSMHASSNSFSHNYDVEETAHRAFSILTRMTEHEQLLGGYWFLKALLGGTLVAFSIFHILRRFTNANLLSNRCLSLLGAAIFFFILIVFNRLTIFIPYLNIGSLVFISGLLYAIGYIFALYKIRKFNFPMIIASFALTFVGIFYWKVNIADGIYANYSNMEIIPYSITAILTTWSVYSLPWEKVKGRTEKILTCIGNNTLSILTWHFLSFKVVSLIIVQIYRLPIGRLADFPVISDYAAKGWWIVYLSIGLFCPLALVYSKEKVKVYI